MTDDEITIGDRKLHYRIEGEGKPLLWIHGFPLGAEIFHEQLSIPGVRHILPDLPGFGQSDPYDVPGDTTIHQYTSDILGLLDALKIEKTSVAGLSMGGYIALDFARIAPSRLTSLILIDTKEQADDEQTRQNRMKAVESIRKTRRTREFVEAMLPKLLGDASRRRSDLVDTVRSLMASASLTAVVAALHAMASRPDSTAVLTEIRCPVLLVAGSEDEITPPEITRRMGDAIAHSTVTIIEGAGHLPPIETPVEFNQAVSSFLNVPIAENQYA